MKEPKQMENTDPEKHNQEPRSKQHIIENILCQLLSLYFAEAENFMQQSACGKDWQSVEVEWEWIDAENC